MNAVIFVGIQAAGKLYASSSAQRGAKSGAQQQADSTAASRPCHRRASGRGLAAHPPPPVAGCPFDQRLDAELARAAANVAVDADDFDEERDGRTPASLLDELF